MKRFSIVCAALTAAVACVSAQSTLSIAQGQGTVAWPPSNPMPMTDTDGNFHIGIVDLTTDSRFVVSNMVDGAHERMAPAGDKLLSPYENSVYDMVEDGQRVTGFASRPIASRSAPSTSTFDLWTDRARYAPGETVWIQAAKFADYPDAKVRYRHGVDVIGEEPLKQEWWPWNPPTTDFEGYLVDVYRLTADGDEEILGSIGVDVSSDWKRFPRYGYTAWYEPEKADYVGGDVAFLNRRHINALQFQDWHWKHHRPYCGEESYTDIFNKPVSKTVVKNFIDAAHSYGMQAFFYNLGFGCLDGDWAEREGVKAEWYLYKDNHHGEKHYHELDSKGGKSDIQFLNPGNGDWQAYLSMRNSEIYDNLQFDGFQVDQIGSLGSTYDYWGNYVNLDEQFSSLLRSLKKAHGSKRLIMNSVSKYGQRQIASSGVIDVCYNECWDESPNFMDLYWINFDNNNYSGNACRTVFANYMNYEFAQNNQGKNFNTPGVLLTDACIFAMGASHLELGTGYNMLCNEYFPNTNIKMNDELVEAITRYYDFATAYAPFLYSTRRELTPEIQSTSGHQLAIWNYQKGPQPRRVTIHGKETERGQLVYHLLNFTNVNSLSWRDLNADQRAPENQSQITLTIEVDRMISDAWVASPDMDACVPQKLSFTQERGAVTVTVPSLRYWTMLVLQ